MNKIEHTSHAGVKFEPNKKLGYYIVNNEIYYSKMQALIEASKKNQTINWFFNEEVFVPYQWSVEPEESLRELYRQRAQHLRDEYDYIRLELSGGSDSTTALYAFVLNNIHIDEVVFRYPTQGQKGVSGDPFDTRPENTLSEWEFAAKPLLDWISTHFPAIKITVHDYTDHMLKEMGKKDESWIFETRHYLQPGHANKHTLTGLIDHKRIADKFYKIGVIYGVDKPKVFIKDDKFFFHFSDVMANHNNPIVGEYTNITNEFFFWSPDCPKLIAKQAHAIKRWFSLDVNQQMQAIIQWPSGNVNARTMYEQIVKRIIYPDYDFHTFQTMKPSNNIYNEMDHWFHTNFKDTSLSAIWKSGIDFLTTSLDPKFMEVRDDRITDIQVFESVYYYLGEAKLPESNYGMKTKSLILDQRSKVTSRRHRHSINGKLLVY